MIIHVGTYGNNCGLFALALGTSLAMKKVGKKPANVPEFIVTIKAQDVQNGFSSAARQEQIARLMRNEIANAMQTDIYYKQSRIKDFVVLCLSLSSPLDMEAFINGNQPIISEIKSAVDSMVSEQADFSLSPVLAMEPQLDEETVNMMRNQLIELMQREFTEMEIGGLFDTYCTDISLRKFYMTCALFHQSWKIVAETDGSEAARWAVKEFASNWFFAKAGQLFSTGATEAERQQMLIELGKCRRFIGGHSEIHFNAREIYTNLLVKKGWEQIFQNYTDYVRNNAVMLSADELNCLARAWKVDLTVSIDGQKRTFTLLDNTFVPELSVSITNSSGIHWDVLADDDSEEDINGSPSKPHSKSLSASSATNSPYLVFGKDEQLESSSKLELSMPKHNNFILTEKNDKKIWPDSIGNPYYWYSVLDGMILLHAIREERFHYTTAQGQPYISQANDDLAATRENVECIFLADAYAITNFSDSFHDDLSVIRGVPASRNNRWAQMPATLILPLISGLYWRVVIITIDYSAGEISIFWDDPGGGKHFSDELKAQLLPSIKKGVVKLFCTQTNFPESSLKKLCFVETTREISFPYIEHNRNNCGPIIFSDIDDYVKASIARQPLTLSIASSTFHNYTYLLQKICRQQQLAYRRMIGLHGDKISSMLKEKASVITRIYPKPILSQDVGKLLNSPYWAGIFYAYIEHCRIVQLQKIEAPYSKKETKKAYKFVRKLKNDEDRQLKEEGEKWSGPIALRDPFSWHVKRHFSGILEKTKKLNCEIILNYLKLMNEEVKRLSNAEKFHQVEQDVCFLFLQRLREHMISKMVFQLSKHTHLDKDAKDYKPVKIGDNNYLDNLTNYYAYTERDHFIHALHRFSPSLENPNIHPLTLAIDTFFLSNIDDPLWQSHIHYLELDAIHTSLFQGGQYFWIEKIKEGKIPEHSLRLWNFIDSGSPTTLRVLRDRNLIKIIHQLTNLEKLFTRENLCTASEAVQEYEKENPGFYVTLLCALYAENQKLQKNGMNSEEKHQKLIKLLEYLRSFGLEKSWKVFQSSPILKLRTQLANRIEPILADCRQQFSDYEMQIDNYRLQFYAQKLADKERQAMRKIEEHYQNSWIQYHEEVQEIDDDPENAEYDYEGIVYPESPPEMPKIESFYNNNSFLPINHQRKLSIQYYPEGKDGLTNPTNLIDVCGGNDALAWLVHQYAEYEIEIWEEVLEAVDFETLGLDRDIAAYILRTTFLHHDYYPYEILKDEFISTVLTRFIEELEKNKNSATEDNPFIMPNLTQLAETIKSTFVQLLQEEKIGELKIRFNDAYHRQDWMEVQKLWPVFSKFQRLLISTEEARELSQKYSKYKPPVKGSDYDFGSQKPENYAALLEKAWKVYDERSSQYYDRIYFSHDVHILRYEEATLDIAPLLGELERIGRKTTDALSKIGESAGNKTNIVLPVLCFVITDKPHQKSGEHRRLFIPINLTSLYQLNLLSKDYDDGVFNIESEETKNTYLKQQANSDYQAGLSIMGKKEDIDISKEHNSKLYHSERVLLEALRKKETVKKIVASLHQELRDQLGHELEEGRYKIYAIALLMYSTNSICNLCTPSLIALQGSHKDGFLKLLSESLNDKDGHFKTRKYDKTNEKQAPEKLPLLTIVAADKPWTEQAHELQIKCEQTPKDSKIMENPKGLLHLPENTIDLHHCGLDEQGNPHPYHRSLVEFVGAKFSARPVRDDKNRFFYRSHIFMSGSKKEKFADKIDDVNTEVDKIIRSPTRA